MTHNAVVLVTCQPNQVTYTKKSLDKLPSVSTAIAVTGAYNLIVKITTSSIKELRKIITNQIQNMKTVHSTLTLSVIQ